MTTVISALQIIQILLIQVWKENFFKTIVYLLFMSSLWISEQSIFRGVLLSLRLIFLFPNCHCGYSRCSSILTRTALPTMYVYMGQRPFESDPGLVLRVRPSFCVPQRYMGISKRRRRKANDTRFRHIRWDRPFPRVALVDLECRSIWNFQRFGIRGFSGARYPGTIHHSVITR